MDAPDSPVRAARWFSTQPATAPEPENTSGWFRLGCTEQLEREEDGDMRKAGAARLGMIFGLPVLLASVLMGVIPAGAASKGQCVRTVCTPGKRSCIGDFTTQFKQAKATCAAGKAGAHCRKDAKAAFNHHFRKNRRAMFGMALVKNGGGGTSPVIFLGSRK